MSMRKALEILSSWLNYKLGNNIAIIAYVGVWFFNVNSHTSFIYITTITHL